ncbi:hypothetical protein OA93_11545 [Flavobacterium sp. KMS]|uniref:hypothetical protein n=1 Tax=Flavobacterium sp. KMS TaxID=1566023 RepID=UPI0005804AFC|nr:hypothetical protein [Flavobacterium sp. KMS]KIA98078.1 hypothetical protein OA93_11545 [Flavobacterium sp. KMS]
MKSSTGIFIFIILLSFFGCKKKEIEKVDELQFEKNVINNVFLEIVDSIYMDRRTILPPPMPRIDFKTNKEDTIGYHAELKKYNLEQDSIKNDKTRILIGVYDDVKKISPQETEMIIKEINLSKYSYDISKETDEYKFDLKTFENNKKFNFQRTSKYPHEKNWNLDDKSNLLPVGTISVSRIQFNKTKTSGILSAGASCGGGRCGRGFLIIIENKSGKWKIDKIIHTWVS